MINPEIQKLMMTSLFDEAKSSPDLALILLRHTRGILERVELKMPNPSELSRSEMRLVLERKKIPAIKEVRARLNLGLKEAKDLVDAWDNEVCPMHLKSISPPLPATSPKLDPYQGYVDKVGPRPSWDDRDERHPEY